MKSSTKYGNASNKNEHTATNPKQRTWIKPLSIRRPLIAGRIATDLSIQAWYERQGWELTLPLMDRLCMEYQI